MAVTFTVPLVPATSALDRLVLTTKSATAAGLFYIVMPPDVPVVKPPPLALTEMGPLPV